jgi:hypothetical protein
LTRTTRFESGKKVYKNVIVVAGGRRKCFSADSLTELKSWMEREYSGDKYMVQDGKRIDFEVLIADRVVRMYGRMLGWSKIGARCGNVCMRRKK